MGWRDDYQALEAKEAATKATKGSSTLEQVHMIDHAPSADLNNLISDPLIQNALNTFEGKIVEICQSGNIIPVENSLNLETNPTTEIENQKLGLKQPTRKVLSTYAIEEVKRIEADAIEKGWTHDQLWNREGWYDERGLACFITNEAKIGEVTPYYIEVVRTNGHGQEQEVRRFHNTKVEQPWMRMKNCQGNRE